MRSTNNTNSTCSQLLDSDFAVGGMGTCTTVAGDVTVDVGGIVGLFMDETLLEICSIRDLHSSSNLSSADTSTVGSKSTVGPSTIL